MKRYLCLIPCLWVALLSLISVLTGCTGETYTFAEHIAPILHGNCSPCHRPQGAAPFSLLTYEDAAKRAKMIAYVTRTGYMPPWPADRHYSHFQNEKVLSREHIQMLQKWYKQGCKQGDLSRLKPYVHRPESALGMPDLVLQVPPVSIQGNNKDRFYVLKVPLSQMSSKIVRALEFVPGQPALVHHVNGHYLDFTDGTDPFRGGMMANIESDSFETEFSRLSLLNADGSLPFRVHSAVNYLPGAYGIRYPEGIGGFVMGKQGAIVLNDIHYGPSRKPTTDSSKINVYFASKMPERPTFELMMGTNGVSPIEPPLRVAPNTVSRHVSQLVVYNDISVLTVNPHMHLIGKSFKAYALKPNGDTVRLIRIPKWQFLWQYFYTFPNPVKIPKGSTIVVEAIFDNTALNPNNPFDPPQTIGERLDRGGASMRTTDEMLQFIITYMPYKTGDEHIDLTRP